MRAVELRGLLDEDVLVSYMINKKFANFSYK